jgi:hypothetical protein
MTTALPVATDFTGAAVTEAGFKTAISAQRQFLADLLGTDGVPATALTALKAALSGVNARSAGSYTLGASDKGLVIYLTGSGDSAFTAPVTSTTGFGTGYECGIVNASSGTITVTRSSTDTIDGGTSITLTAGSSCLLMITAAGKWVTIGRTGLASATAPGSVELATPAEVVTGTSTALAVTPEGFAKASVWQLVETWTATAVASKTFDLQENIYGAWMFVVDNVAPGTDGQALLMRPGYGGQATFETTNCLNGFTLSTGISPAAWSVMEAYATVSKKPGNAAGEYGNAVITLHGPASSVATGLVYQSDCSFQDTASDNRSERIVGAWNGVSVERLWDSVRFLFESGNFKAQGSITMYGLKRAVG